MSPLPGIQAAPLFIGCPSPKPVMKTPIILRNLLLGFLLVASAALLSSPARAYTTETDTWGQIPIGGTGAIPALVIHPKVQDVMYLGADVGAVDRWDAVNQKWIPTMNYKGAPQGCAALAVDPSDTTGNVVYAAMGSADWTPGNIYKSTDRGNTWTIPSTTTFPCSSNSDQGKPQRLAVDPANSNVLYFTPRNGLWRTLDAGVTCTLLTSAPPGDQASFRRGSGSSAGQLVFVDPTSPPTPTPPPTTPPFIPPHGNMKDLASALNASPIVITATSVWGHGYLTGDTIVLSGVAGNTAANGTWTITVINSTTFSLNGSTGNGAYTSSLSTMSKGTIIDNHLYKTEDGGTTWNAMANSPVELKHAESTSTGVLYCTSDMGGVFKYSGGANGAWTVITPKAGGYYNTVAVDPFNDNNIIADQNYPPCVSTDGGATWSYKGVEGVNQTPTAYPPWYMGAPAYNSHFAWGMWNLKFDPFRPGVVWESDSYMPWKTPNIYAPNVQWNSFTAGHEETVGTCALISPPTGAAFLYSGAADVNGFRHTSLTGYPTQPQIYLYSNQLELDGADYEEADPNFVAFVGAQGWNGAGGGGYTTDGGLTYQNFANPAPLPANHAGRIAVSANSPTIVCATRYSPQNVYYSTDTGATWTLSAGLPASPAYLGYSIFYFMNPLCADRKNGPKFYLYHNGGSFYFTPRQEAPLA